FVTVSRLPELEGRRAEPAERRREHGVDKTLLQRDHDSARLISSLIRRLDRVTRRGLRRRRAEEVNRCAAAEQNSDKENGNVFHFSPIRRYPRSVLLLSRTRTGSR